MRKVRVSKTAQGLRSKFHTCYFESINLYRMGIPKVARKVVFLLGFVVIDENDWAIVE